MDEGRERRRCGDHAAPPAWAGLLSARERRQLEILARQWACPELTAPYLRAIVEAALGEATTTYDPAAGDDFLAHVLLALRTRIRRSSREAGHPPPAPT
jgi:hypothetical protein